MQKFAESFSNPDRSRSVSCSILATSDSFRRMIWTRIDNCLLAPPPSKTLPMITSRRKKKKNRNKKKGYNQKETPKFVHRSFGRPGKKTY